jgi:TRAP transporter TAXI family solute receptor
MRQVTMTRPKRSFGDLVRVWVPAAIVTVAGFVVAYQFVDPAPPERFTIATGGASGAYRAFAERYRGVLARHGVELEILQTAGSVENLQLLRDPQAGVQLAFVQGGTGGADAEDLVSLASLYFEPLWVFYRQDAAVRRLGELAGRRIAIGPAGSGTRVIALELLEENGVTADSASLQPIGGAQAVQALTGGRVDAVFLVAGATADTVQSLARAPGIDLLSFDRAAAYTRRHRFLSSVTVPEGVVDPGANVPARDVVLVAPTANLVARPDFHPALVDLMMAAVAEVHRGGGLFEDYGQFPSPKFLEFPLSEEAQRYFDSGPSFLRRVLPFWAATLVERMLVMLLPLVALLIPLLRIMPPVYRWRIRYRIYRWYAELLDIDPAVHGEDEPARLRAGLEELARIEEEVAKVNVPMSYADQLYALRLHLELVREKLQSVLDGGRAG